MGPTCSFNVHRAIASWGWGAYRKHNIHLNQRDQQKMLCSSKVYSFYICLRVSYLKVFVQKKNQLKIIFQKLHLKMVVIRSSTIQLRPTCDTPLDPDLPSETLGYRRPPNAASTKWSCINGLSEGRGNQAPKGRYSRDRVPTTYTEGSFGLDHQPDLTY